MMPKCPWCGDEVTSDEYADHLIDEHYEKDGDTLIGPYPVKKADRE